MNEDLDAVVRDNNEIQRLHELLTTHKTVLKECVEYLKSAYRDTSPEFKRNNGSLVNDMLAKSTALLEGSKGEV